MRNPILGCLLVLILASAGLTTSVLAESGPRQTVEQGVNEVIDVVKDESLEAIERRKRMRNLIGQRFNFEAMSRSILARNWKKATVEQRERFISLFKVLLENTYMAAIEGYTSEKIVFGEVKIKGKKAVVPVTIVLPTGTHAPLQFKLLHADSQWGVYDVVIEGVSLVNNFRSNFRSIVKREGIEGLLNQLKEKVG